MIRRLTGLLATVGILALLVGLPVVLLKVGGNPLPDAWPTIDQLRDWLTRPDDGTLALQAINVAGWIVWLLLAISLLTEIGAAIRGVTAPTLPALRAPQLAIRQLVAAAALLFVSAHTLAGTPVAYADDHQPPPNAPVTQAEANPAEVVAQVPVTPVLIEHIVQPADTLSGLARTYLGDAERWPEIFNASTGLTQPDGQQLTNPDLIRDGWTLKIPVTTSTAHNGTQMIEHVVGAGDTLSGLAAAYLGDANRWPEIYEASTRLAQPDGQQLTHPDLIQPGWHLHIPSNTTQPVTEPASLPATSDPCATPAQPNRAPAEPPTGPTQPPTTAPSATASPAPSAPPPETVPPSTAQPAPSQPAGTDQPQEAESPLDAPWLLTGLTTGGLVLAAAGLAALRGRRRQQFRERHPGRAIVTPQPRLAPVEKTITAVGTKAAPTVAHMDDVLRRLAASLIAADQPMPNLRAVELRTDGDLVLHLDEPAILSAPWQPKSPDQNCWRLPADSTPVAVGYQYQNQPAPWPLLVTCGSTEAGDLWLTNLERLGAVHVTGDIDYRRDYLRYAVVELGLNPWAQHTRISCVGLDDLTAINPERIHTASRSDNLAHQLDRDAITSADQLAQLGADATFARAAQLADEVWAANVLVVGNDQDEPNQDLATLTETITANPGTTLTAVLTDTTGTPSAVPFAFTDQGRVLIPDLGLDLIAVGLTHDEAQGCAALLSVGTDTQDTPMPVDAQADGWQVLADQAGALRQELTLPRDTHDPATGDTLITDEVPLPASAAETELEALDPKVSTRVRSAVEDNDPDLDQDVADWFATDCARPRLSLLGPVTVRAHGAAIAKRKPFYTEVLSFLALREHGATPDELATALGYTNPSTVRGAAKTVRDWLGTNPRTGQPHLPAADKSEASKQRGVGVYQVEDLLIDIDLFRRLRLRGQTRGAHGIEDLVTALRLVTGRPFDQLRPGGWTWLADTGTDHHMVCAIVDVAHLLTVHFYQTNQLDRALAATETALLAAPYDEIPKLDLAAIRKAEGHIGEAQRIIDEDICNLIEDDGLPADVGPRTESILLSSEWVRRPDRRDVS